MVDCQVKEESVFIYALLFYILKGKITETKMHIFFKVLAEKVSEPYGSRLVLLWCYSLAFRISSIWSMARALSMCTDIFCGFSSIPLHECQDSVLIEPRLLLIQSVLFL